MFAWLADDAAAGGLLKDLFDWFQLLTERGGPLGYFVNASKSWLIVKKEEDVARAREIFSDQPSRQHYHGGSEHLLVRWLSKDITVQRR